MGKFLTDRQRTDRYGDGYYICLDNTLYKATDGSIYLVPRNFVTDNYSIPNACACIVGDSVERDCRPSWVHDFGCAYHALLKLTLTEQQLIKLGYLITHNSEDRDRLYRVCENIPKMYLQLVPVTKGEINNLLGEMMDSLLVPKRKLIRAGVCFNFNWYWTGQKYDFKKLYEVDNHYGNKA